MHAEGLGICRSTEIRESGKSKSFLQCSESRISTHYIFVFLCIIRLLEFEQKQLKGIRESY